MKHGAIKAIYTTVFVALLFSCASSPKKLSGSYFDSNILSSQEFSDDACEKHIPFVYGPAYKSYMPILKVNTLNLQNEETTLFLAFDSGASCMIYTNGLKKISPDNSFFEKSESNYVSLTLTNLSTGTYNLSSAVFSAQKDDFKENVQKPRELKYGLDGTVGLDFFRGCKTLTIDFPRRMMIVDAPPICEEAVKMEKDFLSHYFIPVAINGKNDTAVIDTGAESKMVLRLEWKNDAPVMQRNDFYFYLWNHTPVKSSETWQKIDSLEIGSLAFTNIKALDSRSTRVHIPDSVRNYVQLTNLIGWGLLKDYMIQYDFEHSLFRIRNTPAEKSRGQTLNHAKTKADTITGAKKD